MKVDVLQKGVQVAILAIAATVAPSLEAAQRLGERGIECGVIDARFAKPLDSDLIRDTAEKVRRLIPVEENVLAGGFGSAVRQALKDLEIQVECLGLPDEFVEHGSREILRSQYKLDAPGIAEQILAAFPELAYRLPAESSHL